MSRNIARSSVGGSGSRRDSTVPQPAPPPSSSSSGGWRAKFAQSASQKPMSPVAETDGFETVKYSRGSKASVAGAARLHVYAERPKPSSIYKESCIPVADRDSALMAVQNSKGVKIPKEKYHPGMLIRAAMHEPDLNQGGAASSNITTTTVADAYRTDSKFGPIHTKVRKAIIIALYQDHYLAVPLFTHNGNGLLHKVKPEEFISVRDHRHHGNFKTQSKHGVLATEHLNAGVKPLHEKSTAHITYPISRKYDLPVVHEGHLATEATHHLVKLFNMYAPKATARP